MATGLDGTFTNDNRVTLQAQWDLAAAQDKALAIVEPGTYKLTCTGSGDTRCCLTPGDPTIRYELWLGPGVELKLAGSQVTDVLNVGPLIRISNHSGGGYIGWPYGAPTVRAQGGRLWGNTANQPGWTSASGQDGSRYGQARQHMGIYGRDTIAGGGSHNWVIDNIEISDFFGNAMFWMADADDGLHPPTIASTSNVHWTRIKTDRVGEGLLWSGLYRSSMRHCTAIARSGISIGDFHEPATSTEGYCEDLEAVVADGNGTYSIGGAVCDVYGSASIVVKNLYGRGVNCLLQCHGNLSVGQPTELECGTVVCDGIVADDCGSYVVLWGQKGNITIRNIVVDGMRTGTTSPTLGGLSNTISGQFSLTLENCRLDDATNIACDGAGIFNINNVRMSCLSGWTSHAMGAGGGTSPVLNLSNVVATGYPIGLLFSGVSSPTGRMVNCDFSACTSIKIMQDTATLASLEIPDGLNGSAPSSYLLGQTVQDTKPIQGLNAISGFWTNGATYTTLPTGHKNQRLRISVINNGTATFAPSSTLKLAGNTSVDVTSPDVIDFFYDTANGYWREVARSINH